MRRYTNVSVSRTPSIGPQPLGQEAQQRLVVLADGLDEQVVGARSDDDVVDLGHLGDRLGHGDQRSLSQRMPIIAICWNPSLSGSVTPTTCRMPRSISRFVRARTAASLTPSSAAICGERAPPVGLQVFDDPLVQVGDVLGSAGQRSGSRSRDVGHADRVRPRGRTRPTLPGGWVSSPVPS
jgi:hypothetical protein